MAIVILPLLPEGPIGPFGGIRPRELWILVLNLAVARLLLPYLAAPFTIGAVALAVWWKKSTVHQPERPGNPLQIGPALQMAALFQLVLFAVGGPAVRSATADYGSRAPCSG